MPEETGILIVDDDQIVRTMLAQAFKDAGYVVRTATSVAEAMALCESNRFDVVLSDVRMPEQTGHDLARWLAKAHPTAVPVLMTGWDTDCDDCPIAGRCRMLAKPFHPHQALALVNAALASKTRKPEI